MRVSGTLLDEKANFVQATTSEGMGYWLLTPLRLDDASIIFVNRGFVSERSPPADRRAASATVPPVTITGLLRTNEPGGAFLRHNDPEHDRWYSRDLDAMAKSAGLPTPAPFFIDADAGQNGGDGPIGGLTTVSFPNNHLAYAITWFTSAALLTGAYAWFLRDARQTRMRVDNRAVRMPSRF